MRKFGAPCRDKSRLDGLTRVPSKWSVLSTRPLVRTLPCLPLTTVDSRAFPDHSGEFRAGLDALDAASVRTSSEALLLSCPEEGTDRAEPCALGNLMSAAGSGKFRSTLSCCSAMSRREDVCTLPICWIKFGSKKSSAIYQDIAVCCICTIDASLDFRPLGPTHREQSNTHLNFTHRPHMSII